MNYQKKSHLIKPDQIILGEGDEPIVSLLKGEPIKNDYYHLPNLKNLPYPDYSDLNLTEYNMDHEFPELRITGSRGCVRNCTFCNVNTFWPTYQYRPGKDIAGEMIHLNQKYGVASFEFTDSLINGSIRALNEMCKEIKQARKGKDIAWTWHGNAICRSAKQMPEEVWANMKDAGVSYWRIGVESGSESVREHMGKKSSIEDVHHTFSIAAKYDIPIAFNMLVGYPTETDEDFEDSMSLLRYIAELNKTIPDESKHVLAGVFSCLLFDGTPLVEMDEIMDTINFGHNEYIPAPQMGSGAGYGLRDNEESILTNLHWEIKDHPEGLPYNAAIRLDRMASLTNLGTDLKLIIPNEEADYRKLPRYYANW